MLHRYGNRKGICLYILYCYHKACSVEAGLSARETFSLVTDMMVFSLQCIERSFRLMLRQFQTKWGNAIKSKQRDQELIL